MKLKKYPNLVPTYLCFKPVVVVIYSGDRTEDGGPEKIAEITAKCNYQSVNKEVINDKNQKIEVNGVCYFCGDLVPDVSVISSGYVLIDGHKRDIATGSKAYNPDGTINFTKIEVI